VFVPLFARAEVRGLINLLDLEGSTPSRLRRAAAADARRSMAVALEKRAPLRRDAAPHEEAAALAEVGRDVSSTLDLGTVMDRIANHAKDLLAADHGAIFLANEDRQEFHTIVAVGAIANELSATVVKPGVGIIGSIIKSGRAEYVNDAAHDPRAVQIAGTPATTRSRAHDGRAAARGLRGEGRDGGVAQRRRAVPRERPGFVSAFRCRRRSRSRTRASSPSRSSAPPSSTR
jgi:hypothetical protein